MAFSDICSQIRMGVPVITKIFPRLLISVVGGCESGRIGKIVYKDTSSLDTNNVAERPLRPAKAGLNRTNKATCRLFSFFFFPFFFFLVLPILVCKRTIAYDDSLPVGNDFHSSPALQTGWLVKGANNIRSEGPF
jgi:hypothetical protein